VGKRSPARPPAGRCALVAARSPVGLSYKLTVRHGSRVERERFVELDAALSALREQVESVRAEGPLDEVKALRTFEAGTRVAARVEISTGGWLRGTDAGVDVMGDGSLVAYTGGVGRRELGADGRSAFEAIREHLADG